MLSRILVALLVVFVLLGLWSQRFRYDHIVVSNDHYLVRVDRINGHADILIPGEGWVPSEESWPESDEPEPDHAS